MSSIPQREPLADQIAALVKGSAALREDIADELSDHLDSHAEQSGIKDSQVALCEAAKAFGDPKEIARELRTIHMGGLIMFQRITIVALLLIAGGLAGSAYLSWSTARQTNEQFAKMNERLAALVSLQERQASAPPQSSQSPQTQPAATTAPPVLHRLRIFCGVVGSDRLPAGSQNVLLRRWDTTSTSSTAKFGPYESQADGWFMTDPLAPGRYLVEGRVQPIHADVPPSGIDPRWFRWVHVPKEREPSDIELRWAIEARYQHKVKLDIPSGVSWDREALKSAKLKVRFSRGLSGEELGYESPIYSVDLFEGSTLTGLIPGKAKAFVSLPTEHAYSLDPKPHDGAYRWARAGTIEDIEFMIEVGEVEIPNGGGEVLLKLPSSPSQFTSGIIYDGTQDKPVADTPFELVYYRGGDSPEHDVLWYRTEALRTDAKGRFVAYAGNAGRQLMPRRNDTCQPNGLMGISVPWKTPDGRPARLNAVLSESHAEILPLTSGSLFLGIDLSKTALVRIAFAGTRKIWTGPKIEWAQYCINSKGGHYYTEYYAYSETLQPPQTASFERLLLAGEYVFSGLVVIEEAQPSAPEVRKLLEYSQDAKLNLPAGKVVEVTFDIDKPDKWKLKRTDYAKDLPASTTGATVPVPAAQQTSFIGRVATQPSSRPSGRGRDRER